MMTILQNRTEYEIHGCVVCVRLFNVLVVYARNHHIVRCTVTNPGGHVVPDPHHLLLACESHSAEEVASAHERWLEINGRE